MSLVEKLTNIIEILSNKYENISSKTAALTRILKLRDSCVKANGYFTLLWHNSSFEKKIEKEIYEKVIGKDLYG